MDKKVRINVKLLATYRNVLPQGSKDSQTFIEVDHNTFPEMVLTIFSLPPIPESVILVNGKSPNLSRPLQDGDEICVFPAMAGGGK